MRYIRWGFWIALLSVVFGFLHYTLPQRDIVRIIGTDVRRIDYEGDYSLFWASPDSTVANATSRDVFFIDAVYPSGKVMTYRNEKTGWGWPPYFKLDTSALNAQAKELTSTSAEPVWVAITHYGWRNQIIDIFPNAVKIKRVDGPDVTLIPWANIAILGGVLFVVLLIRRMWLQFRERMIEPAIDRIDARADEARANARGLRVRLSNWWKNRK